MVIEGLKSNYRTQK